MPRAANVRPYHWLAENYDELFLSQVSPIEAAREKMLVRILPQVRVACDLACGTGTTAVSFARRGIRTYALDISESMVRLAAEKARHSGVSIAVSQADMRDFRLPEKVDLITCESDALNHVPRKSDLRLVAKAVARALRKDGYFFFDVNNAAGFARYWTGTTVVEKPGAVMVMRNSHGADHAACDIDLFVREGACWHRHKERVEEVCWSAKEMRETLLHAGFDRIRAWDAARFFGPNSPVSPGCHTFYLARKAG